jgi:hypothetical protein
MRSEAFSNAKPFGGHPGAPAVTNSAALTSASLDRIPSCCIRDGALVQDTTLVVPQKHPIECLGLCGPRKDSMRGTVSAGRGFTGANKVNGICGLYRLRKTRWEPRFLKEHDFSRAAQSHRISVALAAEGWVFATIRHSSRVFPQPLSPGPDTPPLTML